MRPRWQRMMSQGGSLPLALLVTILVAGVAVVLVARTMSSQDQVRHDQVFHGALPGADAAVQVSKARLNLGVEFDRADASGNVAETKSARLFVPGERTVLETSDPDEEGRTYAWTMEKLDEANWEVDVTAFDEREGVERRVLAVIQEQPLTDVAAFAETLLSFQGANTADSYNSDTQQWCTGRGWVGSNNDISFQGGASSPKPNCDRPVGRTVDQVFLFDFDDDDEATVTDDAFPGGDRCDNNSNSENCTDAGAGYPAPETSEERLDFGITEIDGGTSVEFIQEALDNCDPADELGEWSASTYIDGDDQPIDDPSTNTPLLDANGRLAPADNAAQAMISPEFDLSGGHYCAESLTFDRDVQLAPGAGLEEPVIIFVEDEVILDRGSGQGTRRVDVGCPPGPAVLDGGPGIGCHRGLDEDDQTYPEAAGLIIFVLNGDVALRNQSQFAGVMYAPRALCRGSGQGGGSNAQADIYGSVICDTITNAGGWRFHFDEALTDLLSGEFIRTDWREVAPE